MMPTAWLLKQCVRILRLRRIARKDLRLLLKKGIHTLKIDLIERKFKLKLVFESKLKKYEEDFSKPLTILLFYSSESIK